MTRTLFMVLLAIVYMVCASENGFAESKPLVFRTAGDSIYSDKEGHPKPRIPSHRPVFPYVEYDSDNNSLTFESTAEQLITYYIEQQNRGRVQDGELQLRPNVKTAVYLSALCPDEECCLYIWVNGILYVGEIK